MSQRLTGDVVVRALEHVTAEREKPQCIRVDDGHEFIAGRLAMLACFKGVTLDFRRL